MLTGGDLETKWIVKQTNKNTKTNKTKQTKPKTKQINKNKQKKSTKKHTPKNSLPQKKLTDNQKIFQQYIDMWQKWVINFRIEWKTF